MSDVKICKICDGEGQVYHEGDERCGDDSYWTTCTNCNGTGRTIILSITYVIPYTKDKSNLYKADEECHSIMRKLVELEKQKNKDV